MSCSIWSPVSRHRSAQRWIFRPDAYAKIRSCSVSVPTVDLSRQTIISFSGRCRKGKEMAVAKGYYHLYLQQWAHRSPWVTTVFQRPSLFIGFLNQQQTGTAKITMPVKNFMFSSAKKESTLDRGYQQSRVPLLHPSACYHPVEVFLPYRHQWAKIPRLRKKLNKVTPNPCTSEHQSCPSRMPRICSKWYRRPNLHPSLSFQGTGQAFLRAANSIERITQ